MSRIYFISDVHLGAHTGEIEWRKTRRLVSFLKSLQTRANYLYIVGDLYDYWFEYRKAIPKVNIRVLSALEQLVASGTEVRYFIGNHDLWHETYLETELGLRIYTTPLAISHNSLRFFIAHGDGLTAREWKLRLAKRVMSNKVSTFFYRWLHPDLGLPLMQFCSNKSKRKGPNPYTPLYREFARNKHKDGFDVVILGHTHQPVFEEESGKYFVNLGDWVGHFTYLELNGASPVLKTWDSED